MGKECKGGGNSAHEPGAATRWGQAGKGRRHRLTCKCGIHSLIGVIDPPLFLWYFSGWPKRPFKIPIPINLTRRSTV